MEKTSRFCVGVDVNGLTHLVKENETDFLSSGAASTVRS